MGVETTPAKLVGEMVEFSCFKCGKLLRISKQIIGQQAQCPGCRTILNVPAPGTIPAENAPSPASDPVIAPSPEKHSALNSAPLRFEPAPPQSHSPPSFLPAPSAPPPVNKVNNPPARATRPAPTAQIPDLALPDTLAGSMMTLPEQLGSGGDMSPTQRCFERIIAELRKVYIGQDELILGSLIALFSNGHVLIESVPGLGKTLFVRTLGRALGCRFGRIQFTADLMPSDITGSPIFDMQAQQFRFHPGPVFTQILLADEINRSPAKTHAALLEIMQEYRVTVERTSHVLERPFLVLATQNPIESEGTYNLPEAQLDRFMFKLTVDYPTAEQELRVLKTHGGQTSLDELLEREVQTVTSPAEINSLIQSHACVRVDDRLFDYVNRIVRLTREWPQFHMGASPRAGLALVQGARTLAAFNGRDYAVPDDVLQIVLPTLRHRVVLTAEADVEGHRVDEQLRELMRTVEVPNMSTTG